MDTPSPIRALLLDVGGTLWPDDWNDPDAVEATRARQLESSLYLDISVALALSAQLQERVVKQVIESRQTGNLSQDSNSVAADALSRFSIKPTSANILAVRDAMYVSPRDQFVPFPGAEKLLRTASDVGLRCVVISNTSWRRGSDYERDFTEYGLSKYIAAYITSADVSYRKPHCEMFESAVRAAKCKPEECAMLGNSETKDILPANRLGMYTIRVDHEGGEPCESVADAVVRSLSEAAVVLASWLSECRTSSAGQIH